MAANGEPGADYFVLLGRLKIQQKYFIEAEENLKQAIVLKHEVGLIEICVLLSFSAKIVAATVSGSDSADFTAGFSVVCRPGFCWT